MNRATIRFYQELNGFLPEQYKNRPIEHEFIGEPAVKDVIESFGVPHTEVDLVLINNDSVPFDAPVRHGDRVSVYPMFESLDISRTSRVRKEPLRVTRFVLDVHLGKLARLLRMLGFDTVYEKYYSDPELVDIARREDRIILTRDQGLLKRKAVTHGYWIRSTEPLEQTAEVIRRFDLGRQVRPFRRCMVCNGLIEPVDKTEIEDRLEPGTREHYDEFFRCVWCGRIFWKGSHFKSLIEKIRAVTEHRPDHATGDVPDHEGDRTPGTKTEGSDSGADGRDSNGGHSGGPR